LFISNNLKIYSINLSEKKISGCFVDNFEKNLKYDKYFSFSSLLVNRNDNDEHLYSFCFGSIFKINENKSSIKRIFDFDENSHITILNFNNLLFACDSKYLYKFQYDIFDDGDSFNVLWKTQLIEKNSKYTFSLLLYVKNI
jgi:hypothetical protein